RWFTRVMFKRVSRVIILGETLKYICKGLVHDRRIAVIPNGVNYQEFCITQRHASSKTRVKILYLSSLRKRKGLFQVIEALPHIILKHPDVRITFAGEWQDDDDKRNALALIEMNGLSRYVTFAGEVEGTEKI